MVAVILADLLEGQGLRCGGATGGRFNEITIGIKASHLDQNGGWRDDSGFVFDECLDLVRTAWTEVIDRREAFLAVLIHGNSAEAEIIGWGEGERGG